VKTTLYKVRWSGYDRTGDTWEPITHLQGYASMVKAFKESHEKDVERLAADRRREAESKESHALKNAPKHCYESTLLMQGTQYPTSNLVMPQLHQMITGLQMPKITYVHTVQRETISIEEALEKSVMLEKLKLILKARTQMVESIYKYFDLDLSESHRAKLYICTLLDPRAVESTTSTGACSSYVKCGPKLSKLLRMKKMMLR
jgi:hypothetical protein